MGNRQRTAFMWAHVKAVFSHTGAYLSVCTLWDKIVLKSAYASVNQVEKSMLPVVRSKIFSTSTAGIS